MYKIEIAKESRRKKEMKKKFVVALVAAMSLTIAGTGTVFAMDKVSTIASEKEHVHGDNCEWVVDKEAWDEEVVVVDKPAWDEEVEVPEQGHYETVVVKPAWDEEVTEILDVCHNCGHIVTSPEDWIAHSKQNINCSSYGSKEVTHIIHHEAVTEQKWVVDVPAHTEIVHHDAITHIEIVHHPEEGHWVCNGEPQKPEQKPENPDQKPEQPENPDQKPEQPENPDQKPEQPENPDVETPETPDAENPATPEQKPEAPTTPEENKENVQTQATETKKEGTSPKTGDTSSALPVAGAGLASLGAVLATILKKRK